jgi:hypothetical protein
VTGARVLVVGVDPARLEGWDPEPVQAAIARGQARLRALGIDREAPPAAIRQTTRRSNQDL